ncbi:MAG: hypothetical protein ACK5HR_06005 [Mycoplasmatales bacterium]
MNETNSLELEPEVINQRDSSSNINENLSKKYNIDIYTDSSNKQIYDDDEIKKTIYSDDKEYKLNTVQYLVEPYFTEVQEYPQYVEVNMSDIGNKVLMFVVFIQLMIMFYFIVIYVKKRRQKNEKLHNQLYQMGTK